MLRSPWFLYHRTFLSVTIYAISLVIVSALSAFFIYFILILLSFYNFNYYQLIHTLHTFSYRCRQKPQPCTYYNPVDIFRFINTHYCFHPRWLRVQLTWLFLRTFFIWSWLVSFGWSLQIARSHSYHKSVSSSFFYSYCLHVRIT